MLLSLLTGICVFWLLFPLVSGCVARVLPSRPLFAPVQFADFACVVTVYKNLDIALPLIDSLLKQQYPGFHIYLVADRVEAAGKPPNNARLSMIFPAQALDSKVRSISVAMSAFTRRHDYVVIFDPDNLAHPQFLQELNRLHQQGFGAVQGKRTAKNLDTVYAALDALGEYYYDYTVRETPFRLGASSTIAGSGMSIRYDLYAANITREMAELERAGIVVSEDKSLQLDLVQAGCRIAYAPRAILFDEKVTTSVQVSRQRTRWLNSYFRHAADALSALWKGLRKADWNCTWFALTVLMPPMVVLAGASLLVLALDLLFAPRLVAWMLAGLAGFAGMFILALRFNHAPRAIWQALPRIPLFVTSQVLSLLRIRAANKDFMNTAHSRPLSFEEVWAQRGADFRYLFRDDREG